MKLVTVKEIRELSKEVTLEYGTKQTVYPGDVTGYLVNGSIRVPIDSNNRLYRKIQKSPIEIEPAYTEEELVNKLQSIKINELKVNRDKQTKNIVVTLSTGEKIDGDETSQIRLNRAYVNLGDDEEIDWISNDNKLVKLNKDKIKVVLRKAGELQTKIFVDYANKRDDVLGCKTIEELQNVEV